MDEILDKLRAALADGASPELRADGAAACRAIIVALEAKPGQPLTGAAAPTAPPPPSAHPLAALGNLPIDQVLDLAIVKLRSMLPPATAATAPPAEPPLVARIYMGRR